MIITIYVPVKKNQIIRAGVVTFHPCGDSRFDFSKHKVVEARENFGNKIEIECSAGDIIGTVEINEEGLHVFYYVVESGGNYVQKWAFEAYEYWCEKNDLEKLYR